jgi:hypothetical protein
LASSPDKSVRGLELDTLSTGDLEDDEDDDEDDEADDDNNDDDDVKTMILMILSSKYYCLVEANGLRLNSVREQTAILGCCKESLGEICIFPTKKLVG